MLTKKINELLRHREFIYVATSDLNGRPNAAPKFLLKIEGNFIYLVDYVIGKTWENLKTNPKASLSFMNIDNLTGYQINGTVEIIDSGKERDNIIKELREKEIDFTAERIIEGIHKERKSQHFEAAFPENAAIFKVKIEEAVEIRPSGKLDREKS